MTPRARLIAAAILLATTALGCSRPRVAGPDALDTPLRDERGVEVQYWTVTLDPMQVLEALTEAHDGADAIENNNAWRANALRVYRVPADRLAPLRARLERAGAAERRWIRPGRAYERLSEARVAHDGMILLDSGPFRLHGERPELLARCWIEPVITERSVGAAMRIELLPRIADAGRPQVGARVDRPGSDGLPLERLAATVAARPGEAFVIAPLDPDLDLPDPSEEDAGTPDAGVGPPPPPRPQLLGEALLGVGTRERGGYADRPVRRVIVLIPSVPEHFSLLGRGARAGR